MRRIGSRHRMVRNKQTALAEFMEQMEADYPGLGVHRRKPHDDPEYCEVCLSFIRRQQDRVRYLGKVVDPRGNEE